MNDSVPRVFSSKRYISLVVGVDGVHFYVAGGAFDEKNTLGKITLYCVIDYCDVRELQSLDARTSITLDDVIIFNSCIVLLPSTQNSIILILFYRIVLEKAIASETIFGNGNYAVLKVLSDLIHKDEGICRNNFNANLALLKLAPLNFAAVSPMYPDSWAINILKFYPKVSLPCPSALRIYPNRRTLVDLTVGNQNLTLFLTVFVLFSLCPPQHDASLPCFFIYRRFSSFKLLQFLCLLLL
jgi:hypothetical protein